MEWGNIQNWFLGDGRSRELRETEALWQVAEATWRRSPACAQPYTDHIINLVLPVWAKRPEMPADPIMEAICRAAHDLLLWERFCPIEPDWTAVQEDLATAVRFRAMAQKRRLWAEQFDRRFGIVADALRPVFSTLVEGLPDGCIDDAGEALFEVPLIEAVEEPAGLLKAFIEAPFNPQTIALGIFSELREAYVNNMLAASGLPTDANLEAVRHRFVYPDAARGKSPSALVDAYLGGTPFEALFETPVPFRFPTESRFEHAHVIGGTGHGKTQLLQRMIHADLAAAQTEQRSVVVIDSQGDLINKLVRLDLFDPEGPDTLADRLILIDPSDVEFPAALNLFDAHLERLRDYRAVDRERVLNGVIELYELFFGAMLGAELTQKQGVIFRYLARLMLAIDGSTIHTLMQLMEDGRPFKPQMQSLEGSARHFFETEFFHPSFTATKRQILKRLWGVLSTPAFERMFAQKANKLDLFEAINAGKIILISTAKDLLKRDGSALFGRFFIALLAQAALERSTLDPEDRTPTFVYIDEAQEYFDDSIETILTQARKYRVGMTLAHQTLDQLSPRLRAAILANTSLKFAGGVSARDARALAEELRTEPAFIENMRRRSDRTEFAAWLKHATPRAIRLSVPLGFLEREPILTEEAFAGVIARNRRQYCGTLADVLDFRPVAQVDYPPPQASQPRPPVVEPPSPQPDSPRPDSPKPLQEPRSQDLGKGGSQHRYVQNVVKGLAEARGFRAVIEEPVPGGFIDVGLHRGELAIACEISVTSKPSYEAANLTKALAAGFTHVFAIAATPNRLSKIEDAVAPTLSEADKAKVIFLTPDLIPDALSAMDAPPVEPTVVRGYRVKVSRTALAGDEGRDRRAAVARVIAQSMRTLPKTGGD